MDLDAQISMMFQAEIEQPRRHVVTACFILQVARSSNSYWPVGHFLWWEANPDVTDSFGPGPFPGYRSTDKPECAARFYTERDAWEEAQDLTRADVSYRAVRLVITVEG